jgi:DMSO/TMAO reductase YedYZ molybdopterin-dependent catalytic subunit
VYSALGEPEVRRDEAGIRVFGQVGRELALGWGELMGLPKVRKVIDFHCVTKWSRTGDDWEGVALRPLLDSAKPMGAYIMFHCHDGYTANLPAEYVDGDAMLAYSFNGRPLEREHGGPLRAFIPRLYGWKSAKWVKSIEVMKEDRPGFWEQRGYNMRGDWKLEERYWGGVNFVDKVKSILGARKGQGGDA